MAGKSGRTISNTPAGGLKEKIISLEGALVLALIAVNVLGACLSSTYNFTNIMRESPRYLAEIFMLFGIGFILVLGDIDISVGSIVCLAATVGCLSSNAGLPIGLVILITLATGLVCGMVNGFFATQFTELPTMIITLGTQIIFRGIAEVALGSGGSASMNDIAGIGVLRVKVGPFPISFFLVVIFAALFITVLSRTTFGRKLYAIGSSKTAAYYAGVDVQKIRFFCYSLLGFLAGMCGLFLLASTYGANTTTGQGFEMEVIAMCVFGGIATTGGKGNLIGAFIASFIIVCLRIALGQINMNTQLILVIIGVMLTTDQTQALLTNYPELKCICAPTTVGIAAAAKVLQDQKSSVKLTGLGLPSEMKEYIGADDAHSCPYMFLWNPIDLGKLAAYASIALVDGTITGAVGDSFEAGDMENSPYTLSAVAGDESASEIILGPPFKFDPDNIEEWAAVY